jgi:translation initiation factor IF-2
VSSGAAELPLVVKADVHGSMEAVVDAIESAHQPSTEVIVRLVSASVGQLSDTDIDMASAAGARLIGFNVKAPAPVMALSRMHNVPVYTYTVIYSMVR